MNISLSLQKDQIKSKWSGGQTTELKIYPNSSEYQQRNFQFRISTAIVENEHSAFTALPGFDRVLMLLEGKIEIRHKENHTISLVPFEKDYFKGSWETECNGTGIDFNLILNESKKGDLVKLELSNADQKNINIIENTFCGIYIWKGSVDINKEKISAKEKDFIFIEAENKNEILTLTAKDNSILILSFVF